MCPLLTGKPAVQGTFGIVTIGIPIAQGLLLLKTWRSAWAGSRCARIVRLSKQQAGVGAGKACPELMVSKVALERISLKVIAIVAITQLSM